MKCDVCLKKKSIKEIDEDEDYEKSLCSKHMRELYKYAGLIK